MAAATTASQVAKSNSNPVARASTDFFSTPFRRTLSPILMRTMTATAAAVPK